MMGHPPIGSKYQRIAVLGHGGMGEVFLAITRGPGNLTKLVVIKCLRPEYALHPVYRMMFLDEARLAARLNHPHLVHVYEVGEQGGDYFVAMEYLNGQSLFNVMRKLDELQERLPEPMVARMLYDTLEGLHHAHQLRDYDDTPLHIVHRDIKPDNIFITYDGQVKVVDFGIAKATLNESHTLVGDVKGTLGYMAPEQAAGGDIDRRTDIFSVGIVMWELLAGRRLLPDNSSKSQTKLFIEEAPYLYDIDRLIDRGLADIVACALKLDPNQRFLTALKMREAIKTSFGIENFAQREELRLFMSSLFQTEREASQRYVQTCMQAADVDRNFNTRPQSISSKNPYDLILQEDGKPTGVLSGDPATTVHNPLVRSDITLSQAIYIFTKSMAEKIKARSLISLALVLLSIVALVGGLQVGKYIRNRVTHNRDRSSAMATAIPIASQSSRVPIVSNDVILRLHGSGTVGQALVPTLAEAFLKSKGAHHVERQLGDGVHWSHVSGALSGNPTAQIEIVMQGDSTGFTDLADHKCDIVMSSHRIRQEEENKLKKTVVDDMTSALTEHVIALDAIAVIVHPDNPINSVSISNLNGIFSGDISDWSQMGQKPEPIQVYSWEDKTGTYQAFKNIVLEKRDVVTNAQRFPPGGPLQPEVAGNRNAIGFCSFLYTGNAKIIAVHDQDSSPLFPTTFTIASEDYPLTRRLYFYTPEQTTNPLIQEFVNFTLSNEGQTIVRSLGFVDLNVKMFDSATACDTHCPPRYRALTRNAHRLSVNFRFLPGGVALDNRAWRDIDRLVAFLRTLRHPKVILLGFSDRTGDRPYALELSRERAMKVEEELRARGVHVATLEGLGDEMPVASREDELSRERNRRVEVWVEIGDK